MTVTIEDIADFIKKLCDRNDKDELFFHFPEPEVCRCCPDGQLCMELTLLAARLKKNVQS